MSLCLLSEDKLCKVTFGKTRMEKTNQGYIFHRLTEKQENALHGNPKYFPEKWFFDYFLRFGLSCANITVDFVTNSKKLVIDIADFEGVNGYENNVAELFVNGIKTDEISSKGRYTFDLSGDSHIKILFPYYGKVILNGIEIEGNSFCEPWKYGKKWLVYGDSIMQGEMATRPSLSCVSRIAEKYNAEVLNESCAGYVCDYKMIDSAVGAKPDIITSSYGINDYRTKTFEDNKRDLFEYCKRIKDEFPLSKIYLLSPIYSKLLCTDNEKDKNNIYKMFKEVSNYCQIPLIDGLNLIPNDAEYFRPDGTHPNDKGFLYYAERLGKIIFE